uniref:NADH dehydrogenase subunit 6 n=1 Tax=Empoasca vitis TaxID=436393 RepID=A0A077D628_EMPVT|nr:NADH dehydrogenase subunit 6 [Empoasca vitis]AIL29208.1 NADH dehydrogenase subunit 6 [Empoasca vitis]UGK73344.1 NADH dehydrogenase subunit 6 [Empoasca vitis]
MKFMIMKFMILVSIMINFIKNPMSMGLMLLFQTLMSIIFINLILKSSWFTMITFLMMIGGLLILIMYLSSIASNEKFKLNINLTMILFMLMFMSDEMLSDWVITENQNLMESSELNISLLKIYNFKSIYVTLMLVIYLLITMVSVSKIVKFFEGPLRMFSYE